MLSQHHHGKSDSARFHEILGTFFKYGMADWVKESAPDFITNHFRSASGDDLLELSQAVRLRLALTELGPTFIKMGQVLSTRGDLVGPDVAAELQQLQSDTPADPPEVVLATIEESLGKPARELYASFDPVAAASASIGQVHIATLDD